MKQILSFFWVVLPLITFGQWQILETGTDASFRSMNVVNKRVIWAGGSQNTVLKSLNSGKTWQNIKVQPETTLDFRGIKAFDKQTALIVSAGLAEEGQAKIFKTSDGGKSWQMVFETNKKGVFLDGIAFFDKSHGLVIGDPINNEAYILETKDAGNTWQRIPPSQIPKLKDGEASFAASNSCLVTFGSHAWYALQSRILHTADGGNSWEILDSKFPSGPTSGIFGLNFWSENDGVILGGDYKDDQSEQVNFSRTTDGGNTWKTSQIKPEGLKESAAYFKSHILVVGTSGSSLSVDAGKSSWQALDNTSFHVVQCSGKKCYAIGAQGHFGKMKMP